MAASTSVRAEHEQREAGDDEADVSHTVERADRLAAELARTRPRGGALAPRLHDEEDGIGEEQREQQRAVDARDPPSSAEQKRAIDAAIITGTS